MKIESRNIFLVLAMLMLPIIFAGCGRDVSRTKTDMAVCLSGNPVFGHEKWSDIMAIAENALLQAAIFEYQCPQAEWEIMDSPPPYMAFIYEISGEEIVLEVLGGGQYPVYRMDIDGSGLRQIGQIQGMN